MISGSLRDVLLADVFQVVVGGRKTGALEVERRGRQASLWFESGALCDARLDGGTQLGEMLIKLDLLSLGQVQTLLANQTSVGGRPPIGAAAVERGWIDEAQLARAVEQQVIEVVTELVTWRSGHFSFSEGGRSPLPPSGHTVDAMRVLLEVAEGQSASGLTMNPEAVLVQTGDPTQMALPAEAWEVLGHLDGRRTARAVAAEVELPEGRTLALLAELSEAGMVGPVQDAVAPALVLLLIADQHEARVLRLALLRIGVRPEVFASLDEGSLAFEQLRPSAVILDERLRPWSFLGALRRRSEGAHVPVLLLGEARPRLLPRWPRPKADRMTRPYDEADLQAWLRHLIPRGAL